MNKRKVIERWSGEIILSMEHICRLLEVPRTPLDGLIREWCYAKDRNDLDRVQELEFEFEETNE